MAIAAPETVFLTGANGYLALHVIQQALAKGWNVIGSVRSEAAAAKARSAFPNTAAGQLTLVPVADITQSSSFEVVFTTCPTPITTIINAASPLINNPEDNRTEVLDPAIQSGTAVLEAAAKYGKNFVKRIIHVGSFTCCLDMSKGVRPGYTYTPDDWNPMTYDEAVAAGEMASYATSKALAERSMWDWIQTQSVGVSFDFVSINPSAIFGPQVIPPADLDHLNVSAQMLWELVVPSEHPSPYNSYHLGVWVDVRDVAAAVLAAATEPSAGGERFVAAQRTHWQLIRDAARAILPELAQRIDVGAPGAGEAARNTTYDVDGSKITRILGIKYRSLQESLADSYSQLLEVEKRQKTE